MYMPKFNSTREFICFMQRHNFEKLYITADGQTAAYIKRVKNSDAMVIAKYSPAVNSSAFILTESELNKVNHFIKYVSRETNKGGENK